MVWSVIALNVDPARGGIIVHHAMDVGAYMTDPRPNSDAAAADFATAAAALGPSTVITFEAAPLGEITNLAVAPGVTLNGVEEHGGKQTVRDFPANPTDKWYGYNTTAGGAKFVALNGGNVTFTFAEPIEAFGAYLSGMQNHGATRNFSFNDGSPQVLEIPHPGFEGGAAFFGFTDEGRSITSVTINMPDDYVSLDDVRFVFLPEPAAGVTLLAGAVVACALRRPPARRLVRSHHLQPTRVTASACETRRPR